MGLAYNDDRENINITNDVMHSVSEFALLCETLMGSAYNNGREIDNWELRILKLYSVFCKIVRTTCNILMGSAYNENRNIDR